MLQLRNDLALDKHIEKCPFCNKAPTFVQWQDRQFVVLTHDCIYVNVDYTSFPKEVDANIAIWNKAVQVARQNILNNIKEIS